MTDRSWPNRYAHACATQVDTGEEDWGWFMWCSREGLRMAVDIFTDDYRVGRFRARVATSRRGLLLGWKEIDTAGLAGLIERIEGAKN
jgi:hypothetical protein